MLGKRMAPDSWSVQARLGGPAGTTTELERSVSLRGRTPERGGRLACGDGPAGTKLVFGLNRRDFPAGCPSNGGQSLYLAQKACGNFLTEASAVIDSRQACF